MVSCDCRHEMENHRKMRIKDVTCFLQNHCKIQCATFMGVALKKLFSGSIAAELNFPYYVQSKQASKQAEKDVSLPPIGRCSLASSKKKKVRKIPSVNCLHHD